MNHFHNPVVATIDIASAGAIVGYWSDVLGHPIGVISTALAGLWYAYCLYEAIEKRFK